MHTLADHYFSSCLDYLESKGLDSRAVLKVINFSEYSDETAEQLAPRVSLSSYNALLNYAKETLNDPLFGFSLGQDVRTADFGVLGYLVESSNNLASAIKALLNYDHLVADIGKAELEHAEDKVIVRWLPHPDCSDQVVLRNMTAWVSVSRQLLHPELSPCSVSFTQACTSEETHRLAKWFNCAVNLGAEYNQIDFPSSFLALPFKTDNKQVNEMFEALSAQQLSRFKSQQLSTEKVTHLLMAQDALNDCTLLRTAVALNMSPRTLQRHLKQENTRFASLLESERKRRLPLYMGEHPLSVVAIKLGFNDQSSFNRAFKRWYGMSPLQYQKLTQKP